MARETKTIQCYPDDNIINEKIKLYESFGWELIGNQRCQEYDGQTKSKDYINGGTTITEHYSTFNKLTFTRDKSEPWYSDVVKLENQHEGLMNSKPCNYAIRPSNNWLLGLIGLPAGFGLTFMFISSGALILIPLLLMAISVLFLIVWGVKKYHQKRDNDNYSSRLREWQRTTAVEAEEIRKKAEDIVNGRYVEKQLENNQSSVSVNEHADIFCTECGSKNPAVNAFCGDCGHKLHK